ncbi:ATP-binding protein [Kitasatospora sp. NPDC001175]|uniref:ATP-binding protein n=1 Tax=Kitasatospora sp. NPDC001175 TaxID=3157103 RepID=UPI003D00D983
MPGILERPPSATGEHSCWLPRHRKSADRARRLLRDFLARLDGGEQYLDTGELLLSELVANAIEHARVPPGRLIQVRFELSPTTLRLEVHDANASHPTARSAGEDDESGRGLWLVDQLSTSWGCHPRPGGIGKAVWCLISPTRRSAA